MSSLVKILLLTYLTFVCSKFGKDAEICGDCRICFPLAKIRFICDNVANYFSKVMDGVTSLGLVIKVGRQIKGKDRLHFCVGGAVFYGRTGADGTSLL